VAALAVIAVASFTQSAMAQTAAAGDVILGIYDAASSNSSPTSLEVDLGSYSNLIANPGESFNLGSVIESTFASDSAASLEFNIAATGNTGGGGLSSKEIAFTAVTVPSLPAHGGNSSFSGELAAIEGSYGTYGTSVTLPSTTSSAGTAVTAVTIPNATTGAFGANAGGPTGYGLGGANLLSAFPSTATLSFYLVPNSNNAESASQVGTFQFSTSGNNDILTFDPVATPEPSAYALGLCALALFWVLKRRNSVA